jgi:hypothetical protein
MERAKHWVCIAVLLNNLFRVCCVLLSRPSDPYDFLEDLKTLWKTESACDHTYFLVIAELCRCSMDDVPSADSEQTGDSTATDGSRTLKGKQPASPSKSAMKAGGSSLKRKRFVCLSLLRRMTYLTSAQN